MNKEPINEYEPEHPPASTALPSSMAHLRREAEAAINKLSLSLAVDDSKLDKGTMQTALHELRMHQIELELQNETMRQTQLELEAARARYFDLYDLAPVAYLTLNDKGLIIEANFTASKLLGLPRNGLKQLPFSRFIRQEDQDNYYLMRKKLLATDAPQWGDLHMARHDLSAFWAHLEATTAQDAQGAVQVRLMLIDISVNHQLQEQQRIGDQALKSISQCVIITGLDLRIISVNEAFVRMTGYGKEEMIGKTCRFLHGPLTSPATVQDIDAALREHREFTGEILNYRKNGETFWNDLTISPVLNAQGQLTHFISALRDITQEKQAAHEINKLVFYDVLTGLPNRRLLQNRLEQCLALASRHPRKSALLFIDLDNFKLVNDTLGHLFGDDLLVQMARRLSTCVRDGDTVARLGGDEFVVMLENLSDVDLDAAAQAQTAAEKILVVLGQEFVLGIHTHICTVSIGITLFGDTRLEPAEEPLKRADLAMYQAKAAGRNTLRFFEPQMQTVMQTRFEMDKGMRKALKLGQFELYYQAQLNQAGRVTGAEVLVRWNDPVRGLVPPGEFIAQAEQSGLIVPLGAWVLDAACQQLARWEKAPTLAHLTLAVNVSARQFSAKDFVIEVQSTILRNGIAPHKLKLEVTESVMVHNIEQVIEKMLVLRDSGVMFSLDDFGTGYSSLTYLKRMPLYQMKIDQGFVRDILQDANDGAICRMVVTMAETMGLQVIAEGVETLAQKDALAELGCLHYQGYLFNRPMPIAAFEAYLAQSPEIKS
jgi:diguanylate cyclase (GGDEF)-like protein/PAS domain S-box-containing protein